MKRKYKYCKYCGAKLKLDVVGQYCPTENCQWNQGLPEEDEWEDNPPQPPETKEE